MVLVSDPATVCLQIWDGDWKVYSICKLKELMVLPSLLSFKYRQPCMLPKHGLSSGVGVLFFRNHSRRPRDASPSSRTRFAREVYLRSYSWLALRWLRLVDGKSQLIKQLSANDKERRVSARYLYFGHYSACTRVRLWIRGWAIVVRYSKKISHCQIHSTFCWIVKMWGQGLDRKCDHMITLTSSNSHKSLDKLRISWQWILVMTEFKEAGLCDIGEE